MGGQRFKLEDYIPVQERINQFWSDHPDGHIVTTLMSDPSDFEICRYRAEIYRGADDARPAAIGHAFERAGQGMANQTSHEENCETSAIGRALANLGYATSHKQRPSREEMGKVSRATPAPVSVAPATSQAVPDTGGGPIDQKGLASLHAKAAERGLGHDDVKAIAAKNYGVASMKDLTVDQGRELYRWLVNADEAGLADEAMRAIELAKTGGK